MLLEWTEWSIFEVSMRHLEDELRLIMSFHIIKEWIEQVMTYNLGLMAWGCKWEASSSLYLIGAPNYSPLNNCILMYCGIVKKHSFDPFGHSLLFMLRFDLGPTSKYMLPGFYFFVLILFNGQKLWIYCNP